MPRDDEAFWDELGISWQALVSDPGFVPARLKARMRLQSALVTAGAVAAGLIGVLGLALAAWALWVGSTGHGWNFLTRGVTLAAVSLLFLMAGLVLRGRERMQTRSLRDMLQLSIMQSQRLIRAADLTCYSLLILMSGGLLGYAPRVRLNRPPSMSPVEDILIVALAGLSLLWFRWVQAHALRRYEHVRRDFDSADELP